MVLWKKKYGTMEKKLRFYSENYGTLIYYQWKKLWYYGKNYGTSVNYSYIIVL